MDRNDHLFHMRGGVSTDERLPDPGAMLFVEAVDDATGECCGGTAMYGEDGKWYWTYDKEKTDEIPYRVYEWLYMYPEEHSPVSAGGDARDLGDAGTDATPWFFCMTVCHHRTGDPIGKRCGVVFAGSREAAERAAWEKHGGDTACRLWVEPIPGDGFDFTVYKSEI